MFKDNFVKAERGASVGTGFRGIYLKATLADLQSVIGPAHVLGSGDDKVSHSWSFQTIVDGALKVVTLYDYKLERPVGRLAVRWNIGGNSTFAAHRFATTVQNALSDLCEIIE